MFFSCTDKILSSRLISLSSRSIKPDVIKASIAQLYRVDIMSGNILGDVHADMKKLNNFINEKIRRYPAMKFIEIKLKDGNSGHLLI